MENKPWKHSGPVSDLTELDDDLLLAAEIEAELRVGQEGGGVVETAASPASCLAPAGAQLELFPSFAEAEERGVDEVGQGDVCEVKHKVFKGHPTTDRQFNLQYRHPLASTLTRTLPHPR